MALLVSAAQTLPMGVAADTHLDRSEVLVFEALMPAPNIVHHNWFHADADFHRGAVQAMLEPLFFTNVTSGDLDCWLARSGHIDETGKIVTIELRHGPRWSDGQRFTSADVKFSIALAMQNPALKGPHVQAVRDAVAMVEAPTSRRVTLTLKAPDPLFLHRYFAPREGLSFPIVPAHVWSKVADPVTFANPAPMGTGPYHWAAQPEGEDAVVWTRGRWWGFAVGWKPRPAPRQLRWLPGVEDAHRPKLLAAHSCAPQFKQ